MPRPKPTLRPKRSGLSDAQRRFFIDETPAAVTQREEWELMEMEYPESAGGYSRELWLEYADELVAEFAAETPGYRPRCWWKWSAPADPRQRVGGRGEYDASQGFEYGTPASWFSIDSADPPQFESSAAFLKRHGLFLANEERRCVPEDFEPELLIFED